MAIDTLDNVKLHLAVVSIGDDDRLNQLRAAADAYIESHLGRTFAGGTFTEYHPGGRRVLFLRNYPITAVTSVRVDPHGDFGSETTRDPADYIVHPDRGLVEARDGAFIPARPGFRVTLDDFPRAVRVIYTAPTDSAPATVKHAYAELIGHWYRQQNTHTELTHTDKLSQTDGSTVTAYPWGVSGGFRVPAGILQLLAGYRVPSLL